MAADEKAAKVSPKIFDIAKPAGTQATSRPIIVGRGAMIRDPMMAPAVWDEPGPAPKSEQVEQSAEKIIVNTNPASEGVNPTDAELDEDLVGPKEPEATVDEPVQDPGLPNAVKQTSTDAASKEAQKTAEVAEPLSSANPQKQKLTLVGKKIQPINSMEGSEKKPVESPEVALGGVLKDPPKDGERSDTAQANMIGGITIDRMMELKNGKEFKVELGKSHGSQTSWAAIVLIVILLAIGAVVALDAGWIDAGITLPFDFIK